VISGLWQGRNEDLEREINKLQQKDQKLEEDKEQVAEQYKQEYMQLKADRDATIDQLKGLLQLTNIMEWWILIFDWITDLTVLYLR